MNHPERAGYLNIFVAASLAILLALAGCTSRSLRNAPVEDRGTARTSAGAASGSSAKSMVPMPGAENAGKLGFYTVKPGDTMIRIGLDTGQNWRDISRWNTIDNPNQIEVGQVLRLSPSPSNAAVVVARPVASQAPVSTSLPVQSNSPGQPAANVAPQASNEASPPSQSGGEDDLTWIWPTQGTQLAGFDEVKNKGIDIAGHAGDAVLASADGRVVYSGAGLRGYGNLIILKHNNTYLTAYAHNQTLLVKEDQAVRKGQKIAEMGSSDADRVKLHFEIRRQGKPVDPLKYLPAR
jgi:lipoprotein NlpD